MRWSLTFLAILALLGCSFEPDLSVYPRCTGSGICAPGCVCLAGEVCVPEDRENRDMLPSMCDPANTCGADLLDDPLNCGECGHVCQFENASATCERGVCMQGECDPGWDNCGNPNDPGCPDSLNTKRYCGDCGTQCGGNLPYCEERVCVATCDLPNLECDGECINPEDNNQHCGACFEDCSVLLNVDSAGCVEAECVIYDCADGFENCDPEVAGCEARLGTDADCLTCGDSCNDIHGSSQCTEQGCATACEGGFADCNGSAVDGCETPLGTQENCTFCGDLCTAGESCGESGCGELVCTGGLINCGGDCVNPAGDPSHCGGCGLACAAGVSCFGGICGGQGLFCDSEPCEGTCCVDVDTGPVCSSSTCELVAIELNCDSGGDCGEAEYCCVLPGPTPVALCAPSCDLEEVVCATDRECLDYPFDSFMACCPSLIAPEYVHVCSESPCAK